MGLDGIPIGSYQLTLNLPYPETVSFNLMNSNTSKVSSVYSYAVRDNTSILISVNSYVTVRFYARDLNNKTFSKANDTLVIIPQIQMYVMGSNGAILSFNFSGIANDS